ncbi:trimeric intracellular cation channel family protein [Microvirga sp. W0021]|uniref:Trimeric intracellular cation channel family protein n=1 Tax=Hohaiivirga grylli TaxID=3133970 RepID=A0ABV0BI09_9HYPH
MSQVNSIELWLNYAGVFLFAATGALVASRRQLDIVAFIFLASLTGIGGGTLRDLILNTPVFWVVDTGYLVACVTAAVCVYFTAHLLESRYRAILWLDAIGLAAYCVVGAEKSLALGFSPSVAIVTGILTAAMGGVLRDMVAGEPSVLMRKEIYVTAALAGSVVYTGSEALGYFPHGVSALISVCVTLIIRGCALQFGWSMPTYKSRPGRTEEELKRDGIINDE